MHPLETLYPSIPWRSPIEVRRTDGARGWACRICIAERGLKADEISTLPSSRWDVVDHIERDH